MCVPSQDLLQGLKFTLKINNITNSLMDKSNIHIEGIYVLKQHFTHAEGSKQKI